MDPDMKPLALYTPRTDYSIKLYVGDDISRCRAILYRDLTEDKALELYDSINSAFGHPRDTDGELIVTAATGPYVLID